MKQRHETNIIFLQIKDDYGFSISQLAEAMECGIDVIKSYVCSPDTNRHLVVPKSKVLLLKLIVKGRHKKTPEPKERQRG